MTGSRSVTIDAEFGLALEAYGYGCNGVRASVECYERGTVICVRKRGWFGWRVLASFRIPSNIQPRSVAWGRDGYHRLVGIPNGAA